MSSNVPPRGQFQTPNPRRILPISKGSPDGDPLQVLLIKRLPRKRLQGGFDLESPGLKKRLRDVLRVLVAACPLSQTGRPEILVGGELVFAHDLLELGDSGNNGPDRLGLAPVWISASLGHEKCLSYKRGIHSVQNRCSIYMILRTLLGFMETQTKCPGNRTLTQYPT